MAVDTKTNIFRKLSDALAEDFGYDYEGKYNIECQSAGLYAYPHSFRDLAIACAYNPILENYAYNDMGEDYPSISIKNEDTGEVTTMTLAQHSGAGENCEWYVGTNKITMCNRMFDKATNATNANTYGNGVFCYTPKTGDLGKVIITILGYGVCVTFDTDSGYAGHYFCEEVHVKGDVASSNADWNVFTAAEGLYNKYVSDSTDYSEFNHHDEFIFWSIDLVDENGGCTNIATFNPDFTTTYNRSLAQGQAPINNRFIISCGGFQLAAAHVIKQDILQSDMFYGIDTMKSSLGMVAGTSSNASESNNDEIGVIVQTATTVKEWTSGEDACAALFGQNNKYAWVAIANAYVESLEGCKDSTQAVYECKTGTLNVSLQNYCRRVPKSSSIGAMNLNYNKFVPVNWEYPNRKISVVNLFGTDLTYSIYGVEDDYTMYGELKISKEYIEENADCEILRFQALKIASTQEFTLYATNTPLVSLVLETEDGYVGHYTAYGSYAETVERGIKFTVRKQNGQFGLQSTIMWW